jgi:vacuolar protein sorting-associated protein 16
VSRASSLSKPSIDLYSYAGKLIRNIPWDKGTIVSLGWSEDERLLIVTSTGDVRCYDIQGEFTQFSLGNGADSYGVKSCRLVQRFSSLCPVLTLMQIL